MPNVGLLSLPAELLLEIFAYVKERKFDIYYPRHNDGKLASYSTICRALQPIIETFTFHTVFIACPWTDLSRFSTLFAHAHRRRAVKLLALSGPKPNPLPDDEELAEAELEAQERSKMHELQASFLSALQKLWAILKSWEDDIEAAEPGSVQGYPLQILLYPPLMMDSSINPPLPRLRRVCELIVDTNHHYWYPWHRSLWYTLDPESVLQILALNVGPTLQDLRYVVYEAFVSSLHDNTIIEGWSLERRLALTITRTLLDHRQFPVLTSVHLAFPEERIFPNDEFIQASMRSIQGQDQLGCVLHTLSTRLKTFRITGTPVLGFELLEGAAAAAGADNSKVPSDSLPTEFLPCWPHLEIFEFSLSAITPSGDCYIKRNSSGTANVINPPMFDRLLRAITHAVTCMPRLRRLQFTINHRRVKRSEACIGVLTEGVPREDAPCFGEADRLVRRWIMTMGWMLCEGWDVPVDVLESWEKWVAGGKLEIYVLG